MSVEHYKLTISLLSEATLVLRPSGRIITVNRAASKLLSTDTSMEGRSLQPFVSSSSDSLLSYLRLCSRSKQILVGALELETPQGVQRFTAKGGVLEPRTEEDEAVILIRLLPQLEANMHFKALKERIDGLNAEVAKRQRAEYELNAQRKWLEVTLNSIGDAVITTDTEGKVTFMNPVAEAMTGWSQEEAAGNPLSRVFVIVNEYTRDPVENPAYRTLREGQVVGLANHTVLITKGGLEICIEDTAAPIAWGGKTEGAILVFHDVSKRRQLEKQLMDRAEVLERANRRKTEFLTMLAHELRNPLAPISSAVEIMSIQPDTPPSFEEPRKIIQRQILHLKRLVDDMLDVSRITRGSIKLIRRSVDLASLTTLACLDLREQFDRGRIYLQTKIPSSKIWVHGDADRLTQVLHNLLVNSSKFTPPGGSVTVSLTVEGPFAVLKVADTGVGIDESDLSDLFEPFTQGAQNLDRSTGGLGLGLSLVKGVVDAHDGQIRATSAGAHEGTTMTVQIPLAEEEDETVDVAELPAVASTQRILLIEDEVDAAATMRRLLELLGHETDVAYTGPEGLEKAVANRPTLIICDIGLPGLDGFAVAEKLRQNPLTSSIPLVALTGYGGSEFVERASRTGFDHHVIKPATIGDIQAVISFAKSGSK